MRIAIIVDKCAPFYLGGYEDRYWNIASRLSVSHDVRVFTSLQKSAQELDGVAFRSILPPAFLSTHPFHRSLAHSALFSVSLIESPFKTWVPEAVIVEAIPYLHLLTVRRWLLKGSWIRVLNVNEAWWHYAYLGSIFSSASRLGVRALLKQGIAWADLTIAISGATAASLVQNFHARQVHVVPMGVEDSLLDRLPARKPTDALFDIITVGRLASYKRHADFVTALSILKERYGWNGRAAIVGDGPCLQGLVQQAKESGVHENVEFLGALDNHSKFNAMAASRLFVLPSEREGFSLSTLEAMALGVPPIVSKPRWPENFGVSELVNAGETGMVYPCGNTEALAECIDWLLQAPLERARLGAAAHEASRGYGWNSIVKRLESLLDSTKRGTRTG